MTYQHEHFSTGRVTVLVRLYVGGANPLRMESCQSTRHHRARANLHRMSGYSFPRHHQTRSMTLTSTSYTQVKRDQSLGDCPLARVNDCEWLKRWRQMIRLTPRVSRAEHLAIPTEPSPDPGNFGTQSRRGRGASPGLHRVAPGLAPCPTA